VEGCCCWKGKGEVAATVIRHQCRLHVLFEGAKAWLGSPAEARIVFADRCEGVHFPNTSFFCLFPAGAAVLRGGLPGPRFLSLAGWLLLGFGAGGGWS